MDKQNSEKLNSNGMGDDFNYQHNASYNQHLSSESQQLVDGFAQNFISAPVTYSKGGIFSYFVIDNMPYHPPVKMPFNWAALWGWLWPLFKGQYKLAFLLLGIQILLSVFVYTPISIVINVIIFSINASSFFPYIISYVLSLVIVMFPVVFYLGKYGGELMWAANPYLTVEEYKKSSKTWVVAFLVWNAIGTIITIITAFLVGSVIPIF